MFTGPTGSRHPLGLAGAVAYGGSSYGLCPGTNTSCRLAAIFMTVAHLCWFSGTDSCTTTKVATVDGTIYSFPADGGIGTMNTFATRVEDKNHNVINIIVI